jgi:hypothetical protein
LSQGKKALVCSQQKTKTDDWFISQTKKIRLLGLFLPAAYTRSGKECSGKALVCAYELCWHSGGVFKGNLSLDYHYTITISSLY